MLRDFQGLGLSYQPLLYFWGGESESVHECWGCGGSVQGRWRYLQSFSQEKRWDYGVELLRLFLTNRVCFRLWVEGSPEPARIVWREKNQTLSRVDWSRCVCNLLQTDRGIVSMAGSQTRSCDNTVRLHKPWFLEWIQIQLKWLKCK